MRIWCNETGLLCSDTGVIVCDECPCGGEPTIDVPCCTPTLVPATLNIAITSDCDALDGVDFEVVYDPEFDDGQWVSSALVCDGWQVRFYCSFGTFYVKIISEFGFKTWAQSAKTCSPFSVTVSAEDDQDGDSPCGCDEADLNNTTFLVTA